MSERAGAGSSERRPWEGVWEVAKDGELRTKKRTPPPARLESVGGDTSKSMAALVGAAACAAAGWVLAHAGGRSPRRVKRNNTLEMPVIAPFEGSTVLVTGCSRGMGPGWCKALLARGTNVIAGCRNPRTAAVVNELAAKGGKGGAWCKVVQLDLGWSENRLAKFAEDLRTKHGVRRLDLLVNNAGLGEADDPLLKASKDNLMSFFEVNTVGPILLTQALLPLMNVEGGRKMVCNLNSDLGSCEKVTTDVPVGSGQITACSYRVTKAGANMATLCLARELNDNDFIFVSMSPGHVDTDMGHLPAPGRPKPTLSVRDSVGGMISVLERLTPEDNGSFHKFNGDVLPW